ncbi:hypothetical protein [Pseudalkalibacillus sp. SCS-8]|uniref:hypothetical protein n=1 Tax=Pseudalkalibacillus nanhaiensis TaxID=3115291 RepID=UPI0032DA60DF
MLQVIKSNRGGVLVVVLMVIMVLGILVPTGFTMYNKLFLNETRLIHQKQAVNLAVSAMETFERQDQLEKVSYLVSNLHVPSAPMVITQPSGQLDLYQYALDKEGKQLSKDKLTRYIGEYTVVVKGVSGDKNHNHQKDPGERFYAEHEMTVVETAGKAEVLIEKKENGKVVDTIWLTFREFLDRYNQANGKSKDECKENNGSKKGKKKDDDDECDEENEGNLIDGDVTVFGVGGDEFNEEDNLILEATGSLTFKGVFTITTKSNGNSKIQLTSQKGDIIIEKTTMQSTGNSSHSDMVIQTPKGNIEVTDSTIESNRGIYILAGFKYEETLGVPVPVSPGRNIKILNSEIGALKKTKKIPVLTQASGSLIKN